MKNLTTLIVGAHFRPPAKQVLQFLPAGAELQFEEENDNPYDAAAVKVFADPGQIPDEVHGLLDEELANCGMTLEMLMSAGPVFLGYVPSQGGKPLQKARQSEPGLLGNEQVRELFLSEDGICLMGSKNAPRVVLGFAPDGSPRALISLRQE